MSPGGRSIGAMVLLRYILLIALRDRVFHALLILLAAGAFLSIFLAGGAIVEQREMAAAYAGAGSRIMIVLGLILFVSFQTRRAIDGGEIALIASRPLSRVTIVLGYSAGTVVIAAICTIFATVLVAISVHPAWDGLAAWAITLFAESAIMALVALFFGLSLSSAVSGALASLGFYTLARLSGLVGALAAESSSGTGLDRVLGTTFQVVSIIVPRLDLFCQSGWLVRGWPAAEPWLGWAAVQTLVFIPLVLAAAMFDFSRKHI